MKSTPGFFRKYRRGFDTASPYTSFLDYLDHLNLDDWEDLLSRALEGGDTYVEQVVAPPLGVDSLEHVSRLLRQASPKASTLAGEAVARVVRRVKALADSEGRNTALIRALDFVGFLGPGRPPSVLGDVCLDEQLPAAVRHEAAMALSEVAPESLDPSRLELERSAPLVPAIFAAARGTNARWLEELFSYPLPAAEVPEAVEYPLRMALRDYERLNGLDRVQRLFEKLEPGTWLRTLVEKLLQESSELAHLQPCLEGAVDTRELPVARKSAPDDENRARIRTLQEKTLRARDDVWSGVGVNQLPKLLSVGEYRKKPLPMHWLSLSVQAQGGGRGTRI